MKNHKWILLVEDNANDADLAVRALTRNPSAHQIVIARNGVDALDCLYRRNLFAGRQAEDPVVVVLDLKMPKLDGLDVLQQIKNDSRLKFIPVVVFTSSREESDLVRCYQLGANAYVVKPVIFKQFVAALQEVGMFWTVFNEVPHQLPHDPGRMQSQLPLDQTISASNQTISLRGEKFDSHLAA